MGRSTQGRSGSKAVSAAGSGSASAGQPALRPADERGVPTGPGSASSDILHAPPGILAAILLTWQLRLAAAGDWLAARLAEERDLGTAFVWSPVVFGLGVAAYFAAPAEPLFWLPPLTAACVALLAARQQAHGFGHMMLVAVAIFFAGLSAAQLRAHIASGPVIAGQVTGEISGLVVHADRNTRGAMRYTIRPDAIEGLSAAELPARIRLSAAARHAPARPGDTIAGIARLQGFSGPAIPGGYDFAFFNWLDRLGGTGFFMGRPAVGAGDGQAQASLAERASISISRLRIAIGERIRAGLPGERGDIVVALVTGDRSGLDEATNEALRRSGLAHILAISGLHMALVALTVMGTVRFTLALSPGLALRFPIRKWAAGAGFVAATAYLLISGGSVATQRAWIMIAIMLGAAMLDRRALTMRNVAIAALVVLAIAPESLLHPGFQMSFAAVAALVAAYERWNRWRRERFLHGGGRWAQRPGILMQLPAYVAGIAFTSLVAGLATGLFAAYHFHRIAPLGLLANILAMPIVSIVVMPLALVSMLLMPYGFEQASLGLLGFSVDQVLAVAGWVNGFGVAGETGLMAPSVLLAGAAGLLLLTLLRSSLRLLGLAMFALMALLWEPAQPPDIIVAQDGRAIALADGVGGIVLLYPRRNRFISDIWLRAWPGGSAMLAGERSGDREAGAKTVPGACGRDHCIATTPQGWRVETVYDPDLLDAACTSADILLAPRLRWVRCDGEKQPALIVKRTDLERLGTHAIRLDREGGISIRTALADNDRPWNAARLAAIAADDRRWNERFPPRPNEAQSEVAPQR